MRIVEEARQQAHRLLRAGSEKDLLLTTHHSSLGHQPDNLGLERLKGRLVLQSGAIVFQ